MSNDLKIVVIFSTETTQTTNPTMTILPSNSEDEFKSFEASMRGDVEDPPQDKSIANGNEVGSSDVNGSATAEEHRSKREPPLHQRSMSISEQAQTYKTNAAPSYLRFIEYPFRIKNVTTGQYLEEATGQCMDGAARGPINQTGSFIGSVMLSMAAIEAGKCEALTGDALLVCAKAGQNMPIYGIKASSLLTVATLIVCIFAGITMPFVGAIVDHTNYRKTLGAGSAFIIVVSVGLQTMISQKLWFPCFLLEVIGGYFLIMHQVCILAYLPDLTHDIVAMGHYAAILTASQYIVQGVFTSAVIVIGIFKSNLVSAKFAAGIACALGTVLMGYAWTYLFRSRPKLRDVPEGNHLLTTGFSQLSVTTKMVFTHYSALKWFMIALLFSPEAGSGVILSIAVTFLTFFVQMNVKEIAIVSIIMLFTNIPGALLSKVMCRIVNPLNSWRMALLCFAINNACIALFVSGSTPADKIKMYCFAATAGMSFGWMFPSQRTLTVAIIPKGQEFEIMGLIAFFGQIVGWMPVLVFTALNEAGVSMRWGLGSISFFLVTSFLISLGCGSYETAVKSVELSSEMYLNNFARRNSNKVETDDDNDVVRNSIKSVQ